MRMCLCIYGCVHMCVMYPSLEFICVCIMYKVLICIWSLFMSKRRMVPKLHTYIHTYMYVACIQSASRNSKSTYLCTYTHACVVHTCMTGAFKISKSETNLYMHAYMHTYMCARHSQHFQIRNSIFHKHTLMHTYLHT
jgi:hypothetical protein